MGSDGTILRTATGRDDEKLDWAAWYVKEYLGRSVTFQIVDEATGGWGHINLDQIYQSDSMQASARREGISFRPTYHFTPQREFMNDPNGLFYYDGVYHLFFQHYGFPNKSWGHATSSDLLHWTEHTDALVPHHGFQAFSGSAVVDIHNTSGLQTGGHPPIVALYTAWGDGQHLAYSTDGGWTWTRYGKVLALPSDELKNFPLSARDPVVIWHEPTQRWIMILYQNFDQTKDGKAFGFYSSPNLKDWTYESRLPGFYVCPDLFELPVAGETGVSQWVILDWEGKQCKYAIGEFDGHGFSVEIGPIPLVYGKGSHAATQTWKQAPARDGRVIQIVNEWEGSYPGEPFQNQMSVPLELSLRRTPAGLRLCRMPIAEVMSLGENTAFTDAFDLQSGESRSFPQATRSFAVDAQVQIPEGGELTLSALNHPITLRQDSMTFDGHSAKLPGTTLSHLLVLCDITSVELFVNGGEISMLYLMDPPADPQPVVWTAGEGVDVSVGPVRVHDIGPTVGVSILTNDDILIADFEQDSYGDWAVTGNAFGDRPVQGPYSDRQTQLEGFTGKGLVNTYRDSHRFKGTLTSPPVTVERKYITCLVAGGGSEHTMVSLRHQGEVVRYATGGHRYDLQPATFDVSEFMGKELQVQMVDMSASHMGFTLVDDIHQSNAARSKPIFEGRRILTDVRIPFEVTGDYLNFPVDDGQTERYLVLTDEQGDHITDFRISLTGGEPVFWAPFDVSGYQGQTITLTVDRILEGHAALDRIHQTDELPDQDKIYRETYRPQFHYGPRVGWVNDPNGLVHYNGTYHLFYQYNPYGMRWNNMRWGYATSTNLVHWTDHGVGFETQLHKEAYSGSGTVDWNNTTGLQRGEHPPLLLYYTECGQRWQERGRHRTGQRLVYSDDGGVSWKEYEKNPVMAPFPKPNGDYYVDRDPIVRWYEPGNHWVMMLYIGGQTFRVFQSANALDWSPVSDFNVPGHNECPDVFEMEVENEPGVKKWVFVSGSGSFGRGDCAKYVVGHFDGREFLKEQESIPMDCGVGNYSTQTFSDAPDGRRIYIAWYTRGFGSLGYPGMPANALFRVPWDLSLYKADDEYRLRRYPVRELETLRGVSHRYQDLIMHPGENLLDEISHDLLDIEAVVESAGAGSFGFRLLGEELRYDAATGILHAFKRTAELQPENGCITLRVLLDRTSIELFGNHGTCVMTSLFQAQHDKPVLEFFVTDQPVRVEQLHVHEMQSIWNGADKRTRAN